MHETASAVTAARRDPTEPPAGRRRLAARLFASVDIASLVFLRIAFGALMLFDLWCESPDIARYYIEPTFHFTFHGFGWVRPWPGDGMYAHFAALALAALCVTLGLCYRAAALVFFVGISHLFLIEQALYLNHMYLIALISFLLIFVPAHRACSVDALLRPRLRSQTAPAWALWLMRAQIGIPYFYAGLAKLNRDWLRGDPLRMWLRDCAERSPLGTLLTHDWVAYLFAYGGLAFDLLVVPALVWRRTRPYAFALALCFHAINSQVFSIGIFPWLMMAATTIFLAPDWPRRLWSRATALFGAQSSRPPVLDPPPTQLRPRQVATLALLSIYLAWQLLFPLRHWLYPGDVAWTEEGHKFAWRMKLRDKSGSVAFFAHDPATGESWRLAVGRHLEGWQREQMIGRPEMLHQFARFLADDLRAQGQGGLEIHVVARVSLNGRPRRLLIDPGVDLAAVRPSLRPAPWILHEPARRGRERAR